MVFGAILAMWDGIETIDDDGADEVEGLDDAPVFQGHPVLVC